MDVLVLGGGPAGRAVAGECARRGLSTALADPAPDRPWRATYGAWADELPSTLRDDVVGARAASRAFGTGEHRLDRTYAVLDTARLRTHLDDRMAGVRVVTGRATGIRDTGAAHTVTLRHTGPRHTGEPGAAGQPGGDEESGRTGELTADVVVDATGASRGRAGVPAEQTAYGIVAPEAVAAPFVAPGEAVFMDWRPDHGRGDREWPTFLYAVPYGDGTVLLEETSLARRPGLGLPELRDRLHARLDRHGVVVPDGAPVERVRFPVDTPRPPAHPVAFGAATPLVHPASGFSVAASLTLAPAVADALAGALTVPGRDRPSDRAARAARAVLWPPAARAVHRLRRYGLDALLDLPSSQVPAFFEAFFRLPPEQARAYLGGRDDLAGTLGAMAGLFGRTPQPARSHMVLSAVRRSPGCFRRVGRSAQ